MAAKNSEHRYENNDVTVTLRILQSCALTISYCFSADLAGQKLGLSYSLSGLAGHYRPTCAMSNYPTVSNNGQKTCLRLRE